MFCAALFAVLFRDGDGVTAGLIGLSVSYAFHTTLSLNFAVRTTNELETSIVSVERIQEYAHIEGEVCADIYRLDFLTFILQKQTRDSNVMTTIDESWPSRGAIVFDNLTLRYRDELDDVLHDLSLSINAGEQIGIVGRTGSGGHRLEGVSDLMRSCLQAKAHWHSLCFVCSNHAPVVC